MATKIHYFEEYETGINGKIRELSNITHGNYSWRHAREGYGKYQDSDVLMLMEDIRRDADYYRQRRRMLQLLEKSGINKNSPSTISTARNNMVSDYNFSSSYSRCWCYM